MDPALATSTSTGQAHGGHVLYAPQLAPASISPLVRQVFEARRDGTTIVVITHDPDVAAAAMQRRIELRDGRIIRDTPAST